MEVDSPGQQPPRFSLWLRIGFWICIAISVAVVLRRLFALVKPSEGGPPQMDGLDDAFASHPHSPSRTFSLRCSSLSSRRLLYFVVRPAPPG